MSNNEHKELIESIERGLEIAEREMLEEKAKNNEDVIVCGDDTYIIFQPKASFKLLYIPTGQENYLFSSRWHSVI